MAKFGGNKFGGSKFGGKTFGGNKFGGGKFGASTPSAKNVKQAPGGVVSRKATSPLNVETAKAKQAPVSAVRRDPSAVSSWGEEAPPVPVRKPAGPTTKPPKGNQVARGPGGFNARKELGDLYLNATSSMFSPKAGGSKKA